MAKYFYSQEVASLVSYIILQHQLNLKSEKIADPHYKLSNNLSHSIVAKYLPLAILYPSESSLAKLAKLAIGC